MKINSNFRDYYDGVQGLGIDYGLTYQRFTVAKPVPRKIFLESSHRYWYGEVRHDTFSVGFCGNVWTGLALSRPNSQYKATQYCYRIKDVDEYLEKFYSAKELDSIYYNRSPNKRYRSYIMPSRGDYISLFKRIHEHNLRTNFHDIFQENYSPVFVVTSIPYQRSIQHTMVVNAQLESVNFMRIMDSYSAYQNIAMYLGSLAVPLKPIPKIDDKTMSEIKGFNKYSFRKDKSK